MDNNWRANVSPVEQHFGVGVGHAYAAVAAGRAESRAPVRTVNRVIAPERHDPMHVWNVVMGPVRVDAAEAHLGRLVLHVVCAGRRGRRGYASRDVYGPH